MKAPKLFLALGAVLLLSLAMFTGCESSDGGGTHVASNTYYGVGFYDPWYHGHYDDHDHDYDVVVKPPSPGAPGVRPPPGEGGPRPSHPIARPPGGSSRPSVSPRPASRPSIPSTPRAAPRGGGGRRR